MASGTGGSAVFRKYCAVIDALSSANGPLRLLEVAESAGLAKSTAHRIISVLCGENIVVYDEGRQDYRMGMRILGWAAKSWHNTDMSRIAEEIMESLHEETGEHANLAIMDGYQAVILYGTQRQYGSMTNAPIGQRAPVHCTAVGKVLAAYLPEDERKTLLEQIDLAAHTELTITDKKRFEKDLAETRERGYAIVKGEEFLFKTGIAAPIFDFRGHAIAALSIFGLTYADDIESFLKLVPKLTKAANSISQQLGQFDSI